MKNIYYGADDKWTEVKCPLCGKLWRKNMFWTGRGMPRIYCKVCGVSVSKRENPRSLSIDQEGNPVID